MKLLILLLLVLATSASANVKCSKSMLAKSHQQMNDKLFLPFDSLLKEVSTFEWNMPKDKSEISKSDLEYVRMSAEQLQSYAIKMQAIINQMLNRPDQSLQDVKLMSEEKDYYEKKKLKMITLAEVASNSFSTMIEELGGLIKLDSLTVKQLRESLEIVKEAYANMNDAAMRGHYSIH